MPVIGTNDEIIIADGLKYIRKVVVGLNADVEPALAHKVILEISTLPAKPLDQVAIGVRHPLGAHFEKRHLQTRKSFRHLRHDEGMKTADDGKLELRETHRLIAIELIQRQAAAGRMH